WPRPVVQTRRKLISNNNERHAYAPFSCELRSCRSRLEQQLLEQSLVVLAPTQALQTVSQAHMRKAVDCATRLRTSHIRANVVQEKYGQTTLNRLRRTRRSFPDGS